VGHRYRPASPKELRPWSCRSFHHKKPKRLAHIAARQDITGSLTASERIGPTDGGFFLQTYADVLKNDDRDAAEQAASFLLGAGWDAESDE
jgi:hypothetical protein